MHNFFLFHLELYSHICRVPPFLQSIEDPRAAQGGSLKGCPVCGGMQFLMGFLHTEDFFFLFLFHRSWTRDFELPKTGGCSTKTDGVNEICTRWRGLLISTILVFPQARLTYLVYP